MNEPTQADFDSAVAAHECHRDRYSGDGAYSCTVHYGPWPCETATITARTAADARASIHTQYQEIADWAVAEAKSLPYGPNNPGQQYADGIRDGLFDAATRIRAISK